MIELPAVAPDVVAATVDPLVGRLRRRADALVGDRENWTMRVGEEGLEVDLGQIVTLAVASPADAVTEAQQVHCGCLLAPRCAHRAAVVLVAPSGEERTAGRTPTEGRNTGAVDDVSADVEAAAQTSGRHLGATERQVLELVHAHLCRLLVRGAHRADPEIMNELAADLQLLRAHRLVIAERALTAVLDGVHAVRGEVTPQTRTDLASGLARLALNVHSLRSTGAHRAVDDELIGRDRQTYRPVGGLTLYPACAEPVHTGSGFAGVVITFVDEQDNVWTLRRIAPSDISGIGQRYASGVDWGGLSCDIRTLTRSKVVVAGATASTTGSLGGGRGPRASLAGAAMPAWERLCAVDGRWRVIEGEVAGGAGSRLVLDTDAGRQDLEHAAVAGRDADGLAMLARARGSRVRVLLRSEGAGPVVRGVRPLDDRIVLPEELDGHLWPGLDLVRRGWFGDLETDAPSESFSPIDVASWVQAPVSVQEVMDRWSVRTALDGAGAILGGAASLERDARGLRGMGAPFGADLLDRLVEAARTGAPAGAGWATDGPTLLRAWLAVTQY